MLNLFSAWAKSKSAWLSLFMSSALLIVTALYFQHIMDLQPCIKCIYQRTAVFGILVSSLMPLIWQHSLTRLLGFIGWGVASIWGFLIAHEHVDMLFAANPFFVVCDIIPNFPAFMPLHEWCQQCLERLAIAVKTRGNFWIWGWHNGCASSLVYMRSLG